MIDYIKLSLPRQIKHPLLTWNGWVWNRQALPAQSTGDIKIVKAVIMAVEDHDLNVFEWGSGRSTIYYAKFLKSQRKNFAWHAMDNSKEWQEAGTNVVSRAKLDANVHIYCSEFSAFWDVPGYTHENVILPHPSSDTAEVAEYVDCPKKLEKRFDLIFIDGRFRRRCLLAARDSLAPKGVVILHDAQRPHYHDALSAYPHVRMFNTGNMPGTSQPSTIALCSLNDGGFIDELAARYGKG